MGKRSDNNCEVNTVGNVFGDKPYSDAAIKKMY